MLWFNGKGKISVIRKMSSYNFKHDVIDWDWIISIELYILRIQSLKRSSGDVTSQSSVTEDGILRRTSLNDYQIVPGTPRRNARYLEFVNELNRISLSWYLFYRRK